MEVISTTTSNPLTGAVSSPAREDALTSVLIARAAELARAGRYGAAEQTLRALDEHSSPPDPRGLDLLARIRAQQGRYREAVALWEQAASSSGAVGAYHAERRRASARWPVARRPLVVGVVVSAIVLVGFSFAMARRSNPEAPGEGSEEAGVSVPAAPAVVSGGGQPALALSFPDSMGLRVSGENNTALVSPDSGLFSDGINLTRRGEAQLTALGESLRLITDSIEIQVVGFTDDLPVRPGAAFRDNNELAVRRAGLVARRLAAISGIPLSTFWVQVGPIASRPVGSDSRYAEPRNRTAVIRIHRL